MTSPFKNLYTKQQKRRIVQNKIVKHTASLFSLSFLLAQIAVPTLELFKPLKASATTTTLGDGSVATGNDATAIGFSSSANGDYSTAIGSYTTASGYYSTALGNGANASNPYSTAVGSYTSASGAGSTAVG